MFYRSIVRDELDVLRQREFERSQAHRSIGIVVVEPLEQRQLLSAGDADPTFGAGGQVVQPVTVPRDSAGGVAVQADGKVLQTTTDLSTHKVGVRRFNSDGSIDTTFGDHGTFLFTPTGGTSGTLNDVIVQAGGKIVAGGSISYADGKRDFLVIRLTAAGALDSSFSGDGVATARFYNGSPSEAFDLLQQPDGKILAGGNAAGHFGLARFNTNGSLDLSFDGDGRSAPTLPGSVPSQQAGGIALTSDGRIVAVGRAFTGGTRGHTDIALARFTSAGKLDTTFGGGDGVTYLHTGAASANNAGNELTLQSDGKIVIVGSADHVGTDLVSELVVARFDALGTPDSGFGSGGIYQQPTGRRIQEGQDVAVLGDGKILVAGDGMRFDPLQTTLNLGVAWPIALTRLNSNGTTDTSFGSNGIATAGLSGVHDIASDMVVTSAGKILVAGTRHQTGGGTSPTEGGVTVRFNANGSVDPTFGINGRAGVDLATHAGSYNGVVVQPDGKTVAAGLTYSLGGGGLDFIVSRYNTDGSLDSSFGKGGHAVIDFFGDSDVANAVALAPDGKIVVTGWARNGNLVEAATARLNANGTLDSSFSGDGRFAEFLPFAAGGQGEAAIDVVVQSDGKIVIAAGNTESSVSMPVVLRYTASGARDNSFSGDGIYVFDNQTPGDPFEIRDIGGMVIQPDNKVVIVGDNGTIKNNLGYFSVIRFDTSGKPDTTFNGDGAAVVTTGGNFPTSHGLALLSNGSFLITGMSDVSGAHIAVRVDANGFFDTSHSINELDSPVALADGSFLVTGDRVEHYTSAGNQDFSAASASDDIFAPAIAVQADGNVVAAGEVLDNGQNLFIPSLAVARYLGEGNVAPPPSNDIVIANRVLTVTGTNNADMITVDPATGGKVTVKLNAESASFDLTAFDSILVNANGGSDKVTINSAITKPATLEGGAGNDSLVGGGGNDVLDGGTGGDTMKGGPGSDTADYSSRTHNLTIGIGTLSDDGEAGEHDNVYLDIEKVIGGSGNDFIRGSAGANVLLGLAGNDTLFGGDGNDALFGGSGNDQLNGEAGNDYLQGQAGADTLNGGIGTDTALADGADTLISIESP